MLRSLPIRLLTAVLALGVAGCGSMSFPAAQGSGGLSVSASSLTVTTNGQVTLHAALPSGQAAAVTWSIVSGGNAASLGEGSVSAAGVYTAPGALSADSAPVEMEARLRSDPSQTAAVTVLLHPGFVQPLLPQDMALTPGATEQVTAQIAEVNAGAVQWSVGTSATGGESAAGELGTLSNAGCRKSEERYTTCSVNYTAPADAPVAEVYVIAAVNGSAVTSPTRVLLDRRGIVSTPVTNQTIQTGPAALGTSGGNDGDFDTYQDGKGNSYVADCCGGTLGALVEDDEKNEYILSNNHVLAESDQGHRGDTIDQPGLIDGACTPLSRPGSTLHPVGTLAYAVPLASQQTNVDAALALAAPGAVDAAGSILQLGAPGQDGAPEAAPPMAGSGETLTAANLGMDVVKSGRTTGLTCSNVEAVALTVKVDYYKDCAETQPYTTKVYTNQIGIGGPHFTDSGDSGALVLDASNAEAIGLYFAGGTDGDGHGLSVANPIGDVLTELSGQAGSRMSLVGTATPHAIACLRYDPAVPAALPHLASAATAQARAAADVAGATLRGAGILGTAAGSSLDDPGAPAVTVYVTNAGTNVPQTVDGARTQVVVTSEAAVLHGTAPAMPAVEAGIHLTAAALARAKSTEQQVARELMSDPAIFGVGVTESEDNPAEAALLVLVDIGRSPEAMPATMDGLRVRYLRLHRFHTTREREGAARLKACGVRG